MATINYRGLSKRGSVTVAMTVTIDQLITAIATDEGLSTEYYTVSSVIDPSKSSLTYGDSSTTLTQLGLVDGGTVLCTTNQTGSKQERQVSKLAIAGKKRFLSGRNSSLNIDNLPTKYIGNAVSNNPNDTLTLTPGVITAGVKKVTYTGYHDDDVAFTDTAVATASTTANNFAISNPGNTVPGDPPEYITVLYTGYLLATYTGTWTFVLSSDDGSYLWIGNTAVSGYTTSNELASASYLGPGTATISLTAGEYYPIRLLYGNGPAEGFLALTYAHTGQSATSDFTGKLFSPGVSLVQGRPWIATLG
jgi:hypothetical protein